MLEVTRSEASIAEEITSELAEKKRAYKRKYKRQHIKVRAQIYIYLQNGILFDEGTCLIQNLSPDGALVTHIALKREAFPIDPFSLKFKITQGEFSGLSASGDPVRFVNNGKLGMGVQFHEFEMDVTES